MRKHVYKKIMTIFFIFSVMMSCKIESSEFLIKTLGLPEVMLGISINQLKENIELRYDNSIDKFIYIETDNDYFDSIHFSHQFNKVKSIEFYKMSGKGIYGIFNAELLDTILSNNLGKPNIAGTKYYQALDAFYITHRWDFQSYYVYWEFLSEHSYERIDIKPASKFVLSKLIIGKKWIF